MKKTKKTVLQVTGILLLILMATIYKSHGDQLVGMRTQWWGILALFGWSYLLATGIYLFVKDNIGLLSLSLGFFLMFNIAVHAGWLQLLNPVR